MIANYFYHGSRDATVMRFNGLRRAELRSVCTRARARAEM